MTESEKLILESFNSLMDELRDFVKNEQLGGNGLMHFEERK